MGRSWIAVVALLYLAQTTLVCAVDPGTIKEDSVDAVLNENPSSARLAEQAFEFGNMATQQAYLKAALVDPRHNEFSANIIASSIGSLVGQDCKIILDVNYPNATSLHRVLDVESPPVEDDMHNWNDICIIEKGEAYPILLFEGNVVSPKYGRGYIKEGITMDDGKVQGANILVDFDTKANKGCPRNRVELLEMLYHYIATGDASKLHLIFPGTLGSRTSFAFKGVGDTVTRQRTLTDFIQRMTPFLRKLRKAFNRDGKRLIVKPAFSSFSGNTFNFAATHHVGNNETPVGTTNGEGKLTRVGGKTKIRSLTLMISAY